MKTLAQAFEQLIGEVSYPFELFDANGNKIYAEDSNNNWNAWDYDADGNMKVFMIPDQYGMPIPFFNDLG